MLLNCCSCTIFKEFISAMSSEMKSYFTGSSSSITALEMGGCRSAVWSREAFPPLENQGCVCAAQVSTDLGYSWLTLKPLGCVSASYTLSSCAIKWHRLPRKILVSYNLGICWENRGAWRVRWLRRNGKGGILLILKHYGRLWNESSLCR